MIRWWKNRRRKPFECERCGRALRRDQKVELGGFFDTEDGPRTGYISATYCKRHGRMAQQTKERTP